MNIFFLAKFTTFYKEAKINNFLNIFPENCPNLINYTPNIKLNFPLSNDKYFV